MHRIASIFVLGVLLSGCAVGRGVVDVDVAEIANPDSRNIVKLTEVTDSRTFHVSPPKPSMPSLQDDDLSDDAIKRRAIARKRNGYGAALGDIVLPEGRTVAGLVREALANALKAQGYRVLAKGDADYDNALPLEADVIEFWSWINPGFWTIKGNHKATVSLKGPWPLKGEERVVHAKANVANMVMATAEWRELFAMGLKNLIDETKALLKKPDALISAPRPEGRFPRISQTVPARQRQLGGS